MKIEVNIGISSKSMPEKYEEMNNNKQIYSGSKNWPKCLLRMVSIRLGL